MNDLELFTGGAPIRRGDCAVVDFDGGQTAVVVIDGEPYPILRHASAAIGLNWSGQEQKIKSDPAICVQEAHTRLPGDDQSRIVLTTDLDGFVLWLAKINANKVSPAAREAVITWQRRAARAIRERFFGKPGAALAAVPTPRELAQLVIAAEDRADAERLRADAAMTVVRELAGPANLWLKLGATGSTLDVGVAAKLFARHGVKIGRQRLYDLLRDWGWVFRRSTEPVQRFIDAGVVDIEMGRRFTVEATGEERQGSARTRLTTKGLAKLADHFGVALDPVEVQRSFDAVASQFGGAA